MSRTYVCLGRFGDICSLLAILRVESLKGDKPRFMVAEKYSDILEGCSFVDPVVFKGEYTEIGRAIKEAEALGGDIVPCQVSGPKDAITEHVFRRFGNVERGGDSFVRDLYKLAGASELWQKQPPLVFDKRDPVREAALVRECIIPKKRLVLVSLRGQSSPFPYADLCMTLLKLRFRQGWQVLDLSEIHAHRLFDLLGLYEKAAALVANDSAPLHLAQACPGLPVCALINDKPTPWFGSPWRPNHLWHCRYSDFPTRAVEMLEAITDVRKPGSHFNPITTTPRIVHVWSRAEETQDNSEFRGAAKESWKALYERDSRWVSFPIEVGSVGKTSSWTFNDGERQPYLRGVLQLAFMRSRPDDIIALTRSHTCIDRVPDFEHPIFSFRSISTKDGLIHNPAADFFAAPCRWWKDRWKEIPDMVMGKDGYWGQYLIGLFRVNGGQIVTGVCHTYHNSNRPSPTTEIAKRVAHNKTLAEDWFKSHGMLDTIPAVSNQAESLPLNLASLPPFSYNPSIYPIKDRMWLTCRHHAAGGFNTQLVIAEIEKHGNATKSAALKLPGHSQEDARLFSLNGQPWICWVESNFDGYTMPRAVVKYGPISNDWKVDPIFQPKHGQNDWSGIEKNWVPFEHEGKLLFLYKSYPQLIIQINGDNVVSVHNSAGIVWPWGEIRGGIILQHKGKLLRFFHSSMRNESPPFFTRYYVGAAIMEAVPPFKTLQISKEPLLRGSIEDDLKAQERLQWGKFKGRVVFPCGAMAADEGWILSLGINDASCCLVRIKDLKL